MMDSNVCLSSASGKFEYLIFTHSKWGDPHCRSGLRKNSQWKSAIEVAQRRVKQLWVKRKNQNRQERPESDCDRASMVTVKRKMSPAFLVGVSRCLGYNIEE